MGNRKFIATRIDIKESNVNESLSGSKYLDVKISIELISSGDISEFINKDGSVDNNKLIEYLLEFNLSNDKNK